MKKQVFAHEFGARNNTQLKIIRLYHGMAGIGIYWCIIEILYENGGEFPMEDIDVMASAFGCESSVVRSIVCDFNLFVVDGGVFWSQEIKDTLEHRQKVSAARSAAGRKGGAPMGNKNRNAEKGAETPVQPMVVPEQQEKEREQNPEPPEQTPEKEKPKHKIFVKPTIEEVQEEINRKGYDIDAKAFIAFYESKGWMIGKNHMKSWKAALVTWQHRREKEQNAGNNGNNINDIWK